MAGNVGIGDGVRDKTLLAQCPCDTRGGLAQGDMIASVPLGNDEAGTCVLLKTITADGSVTRQVTRAAERQGFRVTSPGAEITPGASLLTAVESALERAAVVIAILDQTADSAFWFDLGIAVAKSRPVLVVLVDDDVLLPSSAAGLRTVGPALNDQSLTRALQQTIRRSTVRKEPRKTQTGVALGADAEALERSLNALPRSAAGASETVFESWFTELLRYARVPFDRRSPIDHKDLPRAYAYVDFAVSADELSANLGDPLPVELILGQASRVVPRRSKAFESYLRATEASTVLVVSAAEQPPHIWTISGGDVLACSAMTLVREMRSATFGAAVLAVRNSATRRAPVK